LNLDFSHLKVGMEVMAVDPFYYRPTEVDELVGDSSKAREKLQWCPKHDLNALITDMITSDLQLARREQVMRDNDFLNLSDNE